MQWIAAAERGDPEAQFNLGKCYQDGEGVNKDPERAVHFYKLVADQGHADAQLNLGKCYQYGEGVSKDSEKAFHYLKLAADQGECDAQRFLAQWFPVQFGIAGLEADTREELDLEDQAIDEKEAELLTQALKKSKNLKEITVSYLTESITQLFFEALKENKSLTAFRLLECRLSDACTEALKKNKTLTKLEIRCPRGSSSFSAEEIKYLADGIQANTSLKILCLQSHDFSDEDAKELFGALEVNRSISELDLSDCNLRKGVECLTQVLKENTTLKVLKLSHCGIDSSGMKQIAEVLKFNKHLQEIDVACNEFGLAGAKYLAQAIKTNNSLRTLHYADKEFRKYEHVKPVIDALRVNNSITALGLEFMALGEEGVRDLAEVLKVNKSITHLDASCTYVGEEGLRHFLDALQVNTRLIRVKFASNRDRALAVLFERLDALLQRNDRRHVLTALHSCLSRSGAGESTFSGPSFEQNSLFEIRLLGIVAEFVV